MSIPRDTTPEAAAEQRRIWQAMSDEKRLRLALQWSSWIRRIAIEGCKKRHPDYDDRQLKLAWLRKTMGDDQFFQLFPGEEFDW